MPTYEYRCSSCGHAFEKFQSISAAPIKTCPKCGENAAERMISGGAGFIFKGGGFYETDYRSEGYKKAAEADKTPAASEAKPETKSESTTPAAPSTPPVTTNPTPPPKVDPVKAPPTPPPAGG